MPFWHYSRNQKPTHNQKLLQLFALYEKSKEEWHTIRHSSGEKKKKTERKIQQCFGKWGIALAAIIIICRSVSAITTSAIKAFSLFRFSSAYLFAVVGFTFAFILDERFAIDYMLFYAVFILLHYSIISLRLMFN